MKNKKKYSLFLASKSPRRHELLGWINLPFETVVTGVSEDCQIKDPFEVAKVLAKRKGVAVVDRLKERERDNFCKKFFPVVVGADTIVVLDDEIFGKPETVKDARDMLSRLSGREHRVITGVYIGVFDIISCEYKEKIFAIETDVSFDEISEDLMDNYIASGESMDKAGAYGIQGKALTFISKVNGSYSNVVGFPLSDFITELKNLLGFSQDKEGSWRELFS